MKKVFLSILISLLFIGSAFTETLKVKEVTGKASFEDLPGVYKTIEVGQELSYSTFIKTLLNSEIVFIKEDGKTFKVGAMKNDSIKNLMEIASKKGLKTSSVADYKEVKSKGIATASSRASEAKTDIDWEEE